MHRYFITSTGTGIGKTLVTAAYAHQARSRGMSVRVAKPVISGFMPETMAESDTAILLESVGLPMTPETIDACSPIRFEAPLSPNMAAEREGSTIDFDRLLTRCKAFFAEPADLALMEGVGGVMVPLDETYTVCDLMRRLGVPIIVVAGSYLGTISHTLTALACLRPMEHHLVISESPESPVPPEETVRTLKHFTDCRITILPRLTSWRDPRASVLADLFEPR